MVLRNKIGALNFCREGEGTCFRFSSAVLRDFFQARLRLMQREYFMVTTVIFAS